MSQNKVTFGLKNVHYSKATQSEDGSWIFVTPVALLGAQEFSSEIIGGSQSIYADDSVIATLVQNAGRNITLKLSELSDTFKVDILGYKKLVNGNLVEVTNNGVETFALGFEFQGDAKARRVWFYLCSVTPVNEATKTKGESVEANSITLSIVARPIEVGNYLVTHVIANLGDINYQTFLEASPVLPTFGS
ncbi:MAG: phage tail protein [Firmicutes bacterium]|nr:phage tail protein [Bacillota bacterium]